MCRTLLAPVLLAMVLTASAQQTPAAAADAPLTLDQLRQLLNANGVAEVIANLNVQQLENVRTHLPPWWPDDVWIAESDAIQKVDVVATYYSFYQPCYSQKEARLFIHMYSTPDGHAYARRLVGLEAAPLARGDTPAEARAAAAKHDEELNQRIIHSLDAEDQAEAKAVFGGPRAAAISACVADGLPQAQAAVQATERDGMRVVVDAHHAELVKAKTKYVAKHPEAATPSN